MIIIPIGVSGSGKTTISKQLADSLSWKFYDADDFHSAENIKKMQNGIPLEDSDRIPWLQTIRNAIAQWLQENQNVVLACSALKENYRQMLCLDPEYVKFVYLKGSFDLIQKRLQERNNHFMPEKLLQSQFETLEEPYDILTIDISNSPEKIIETIKKALI